jgi:hypothetical protein
LVLLAAWMAAYAIHAARAADVGEQARIRMLIGSTWDKPNEKVAIDPIVVDGTHAIAGWTQGARGGRALLKKRDDGWAVVLCSGDPLKSPAALVEAGVPEGVAQRLAAALVTEEAKADPQRVKLFSTFEGVMRMDDEEPHRHPEQK